MKSNGSRMALLLLGLALAASLLFAQAKKSTDARRSTEAKKSTDQTKRTFVPENASWAGVDATRLLQEIDADRDGEITREEWDRYFQDHDDNKDGRLTFDEMQLAKNQEKVDEVLDPDYGREEAFRRLDVNKSDQIERREWPGNDRSFRRMDANRDGVISREEFLSRNGRFWNLRFEDLDFNGDGIISRDEWLDSEIAFSRLDHDHNGVVDRYEFYTPK